MLPEVEQYFETVDAAVKTYEEGVDAAAAMPGTDGERTRRINALTAFRDSVVGSAWTLLGAVTDSKVVAWIVARFVDGMDGETREALDQILKRLPMTQAELEEFADGKGWCGDFESYLQEALAAGVFAGVEVDWRDADAVKAALRKLDGWVDRQVHVSSAQRSRLHELVLEVADAARSLLADEEKSADEVPEARTLTVSAPTAVTLPARETSAEDAAAEFDISEWEEWLALQTAAEREFSPSPVYMEQFKTLVSAVARQSAEHGPHSVESSLPATALRNWVTSNVSGADRHMGQLRTLVTPIVMRAAR